MNKKILTGLALGLTVILSGCTKEAVSQNEALQEKDMKFSAGIVEEKTTLSGTSVLWEKGDKISVFAGSTNYSFTTDDSGATAVFYGKCSATTTYYAVYPYQSGAKCSSGTITATVPVEQAVKAESFASGANLTVAKTTGRTFAMKNACALLKFTVGATNINQVSFFSLDGKSIAGKTSITLAADGTPTCSTSSGSSFVSVIPASGTALSANKAYYAVVIPNASLKKGLRAILRTTGGKTLQKDIPYVSKIERNVPLNIGQVDQNAEEITYKLALASTTKTVVPSADTKTSIYLTGGCMGVTAAVKSATLGNVSVKKVSDEEFTVSFTNDMDDPQNSKTAVIVFSAPGSSDLEVTVRQYGKLFIDLSTGKNDYGFVTATTTEEKTFSHTTSKGNTYQFKYTCSYWNSKNYLMFKGGSSSNGYILFPKISGYKLYKVVAHMAYATSSAYKFKGGVYDGSTYMSSANLEFVNGEAPTSVVFDIPEPAEIQYKLRWSINNNCKLVDFTLYYEK